MPNHEKIAKNKIYPGFRPSQLVNGCVEVVRACTLIAFSGLILKFKLEAVRVVQFFLVSQGRAFLRFLSFFFFFKIFLVALFGAVGIC